MSVSSSPPIAVRQTYLIEVSLQVVDLLRVLEESWPELLLGLLLPENQLDVLGGVVDLAVVDIDLGEELELDVVRLLQAVGLAAEGEAGGLEIKLEVLLLAVGHGDGEVDVVLLWLGCV
jgi:hypothetical protein